MGRATAYHPGAGCFATAKRAHVNARDIERMKARGLGVQNIAMQLGCSMEDVRRVLAPPPPSPEPANDPVEIVPKVPPVVFASEEAEAYCFRALWVAGQPRHKIMTAMGISRRRADHLRDKLGLNHRKAGRPVAA